MIIKRHIAYGKFYNLFFFFLITMGYSFCLANTAVTPKDILNDKWWKNRHENILNKKITNPKLILIGNSIINDLELIDRKEVRDKYLNKYKTLNLGFSGDRTENVIWRLLNGEIDGIHPKVAVVLIGTNNTDGNNYPTINTAPELAEGIWKICQIIKKKLPETQILLLGISPFGQNLPNYRNTINQNVNKLISKFPEKDNTIHYLYIGNIFLKEDGRIDSKLMPDYLHPGVEGDLLWFQTMQPYIEVLMK